MTQNNNVAFHPVVAVASSIEQVENGKGQMMTCLVTVANLQG